MILQHFHFLIKTSEFKIILKDSIYQILSFKNIKIRTLILPTDNINESRKQNKLIMLFSSSIIFNLIYQNINMQGNEKNIVSKVTQVKKIFSLGSVECKYQNVESTEKKSENIKDSDVHILSRTCQKNGSFLEKRIQIKYKDVQVSIVDSYDFNDILIPEPNKQKNNAQINSGPVKILVSTDGSQGNGSSKSSGNQEQPKKKMIFKKKCLDRSSMQKNARKTKNIAKNYVKAFMQYLRLINQDEILQETKNMIEGSKYNNSLIYNIIENEVVCQYFKKFLEEKAQTWIRDSKIHNKDGHRVGIKRFLQLIKSSEKNEKVQDDGDIFRSENNELHENQDISDSDSNRLYMSEEQEEEGE